MSDNDETFFIPTNIKQAQEADITSVAIEKQKYIRKGIDGIRQLANKEAYDNEQLQKW